ncbi:MAG: SDR family oxidoreductase [Maricaulaceae bacterium]
MRWLVLGGTGTFGRALLKALKARGWTGVGAARSGAAETLDLTDLDALERTLDRWKPDGVVNAAAWVDLAACEADPGAAYAVNARPVTRLAAWARAQDRPLVQISTDHFFVEGGDRAHPETDPISLVNEYARTKYAAEAFALSASQALVIRTNMTGVHPGRARPTFADWAMQSLKERAPLTLFTDFYCSTIDADCLASTVFDLVEAGARGRLNVASSQVASKYEFVHALAAQMGIALDWAKAGSAQGLNPPRALSLGLDVSKAEGLLGRALPTLDAVCANLVHQSAMSGR